MSGVQSKAARLQEEQKEKPLDTEKEVVPTLDLKYKDVSTVMMKKFNALMEMQDMMFVEMRESLKNDLKEMLVKCSPAEAGSEGGREQQEEPDSASERPTPGEETEGGHSGRDGESSQQSGKQDKAKQPSSGPVVKPSLERSGEAVRGVGAGSGEGRGQGGASEGESRKQGEKDRAAETSHPRRDTLPKPSGEEPGEGAVLRLAADFSAATLGVRGRWGRVFRRLQEKGLQPELLCTVRLAFTWDGEARTFSDLRSLRQFAGTRSLLKELLKDVLPRDETRAAGAGTGLRGSRGKTLGDRKHNAGRTGSDCLSFPFIREVKVAGPEAKADEEETLDWKHKEPPKLEMQEALWLQTEEETSEGETSEMGEEEDSELEEEVKIPEEKQETSEIEEEEDSELEEEVKIPEEKQETSEEETSEMGEEEDSELEEEVKIPEKMQETSEIEEEEDSELEEEVKIPEEKQETSEEETSEKEEEEDSELEEKEKTSELGEEEKTSREEEEGEKSSEIGKEEGASVLGSTFQGLTVVEKHGVRKITRSGEEIGLISLVVDSESEEAVNTKTLSQTKKKETFHALKELAFSYLVWDPMDKKLVKYQGEGGAAATPSRGAGTPCLTLYLASPSESLEAGNGGPKRLSSTNLSVSTQVSPLLMNIEKGKYKTPEIEVLTAKEADLIHETEENFRRCVVSAIRQMQREVENIKKLYFFDVLDMKSSVDDLNSLACMIEARVNDQEDAVEGLTKETLHLAKEIVGKDRQREREDRLRSSNIRVIGIPEKESHGNGAEDIIKEIIEENFAELGDLSLEIISAHRIPNTIDAHRLTPRHILVKFWSPGDKQKILKASRAKKEITYRGSKIRLTADLSPSTIDARSQWSCIIKVLQEEGFQPRILYPAKLAFDFKGKTKVFFDIEDFKKFVSDIPFLKERLSNIL